MKKALKLVLVFFVILLSIGVIGRYGWRLFGFRLCASPESYFFRSVEVNDGVLVATGSAVNAPTYFAKSYGGYVAKQEGSTVYIGIRRNFTKKWNISFKLEIPLNEPVEKIILTDSKSEVPIYDRLFQELSSPLST